MKVTDEKSRFGAGYGSADLYESFTDPEHYFGLHCTTADVDYSWESSLSLALGDPDDFSLFFLFRSGVFFCS